ncbi:MAG TPA: hypothetical protein VL624_02750 [Caldimonas sp.]|nr:hypothetical protein [Caldimonas sp.]
MGYLEHLKRQADDVLAQQRQDTGALQRNAMLTDAACHASSRYLFALARQLNVLQPVSKTVWWLDRKTSFSQLRFSEFRADARMKRLRDVEVFDHIVLNFVARTGSRVTVAKDFPPEIEKLESRLRQCGVHYDSEVVRDAETGKFVEKRFDLVADFQSSVRVVPDHDSARVAFHVANVDGFDTVSVVFPAFEVGTARLDELARWITGEQHAFLRDGEHVRRVPA